MSGNFDVTAATASINMTVGGAGAAGTGAYTLAVLVNPAAGNNNAGFLGLYASATLNRAFFEDTNHLFGNNDFSSGFATLTQGTWYLLIESKVSGSALYEFDVWPYASDGSGTMTRGNSVGSSNQGDGSTITEIRIGANAIKGNGLIAVAGIWNRKLSTTERDSLKSGNLTAWRDVSGGAPDELISLENWNGSTGATAVIGTSSLSTITGTVASGSNPPGFSFALSAASIPYSPQRAMQTRDYGEAQWSQRDRRDANTVASAVNTLPSPLDVAYGAAGPIWQQRGSAADATARTWQVQQRTYLDPSLLTPAVVTPSPSPTRTVPTRDPGEAQWLQRIASGQITTALLENELLGGAETVTRVTSPVTNAPRWWMPQQPKRDATTPGLLDSAELEDALLGGDVRRHGHPAIYTDRREMPQQRAYISDPSFYPTVAPTDPLTIAWGAGGTYALLYATAALQVDRRNVPQQRRYISDPSVLATALLEDALLGNGDVARHAFYITDRRGVPQQTARVDFAGGILADPLFLDGNRWFRAAIAATHAGRRQTVAQRIALLFVGAAAPPVLKATSTSTVTARRTSTAATTARRTSTDAVTAKRTASGGVS